MAIVSSSLFQKQDLTYRPVEWTTDFHHLIYVNSFHVTKNACRQFPLWPTLLLTHYTMSPRSNSLVIVWNIGNVTMTIHTEVGTNIGIEPLLLHGKVLPCQNPRQYLPSWECWQPILSSLVNRFPPRKLPTRAGSTVVQTFGRERWFAWVLKKDVCVHVCIKVQPLFSSVLRVWQAEDHSTDPGVEARKLLHRPLHVTYGLLLVISDEVAEYGESIWVVSKRYILILDGSIVCEFFFGRDAVLPELLIFGSSSCGRVYLLFGRHCTLIESKFSFRLQDI